MNTLKSIFFAATLALTTHSAWAAPAPFGLELGKTTVEQMTAKYTTSYKGVNQYSSGKMYTLVPSELGIEGLNSATAIFDTNDTLIAVLTSLPKSRFDGLHASLSSKYKVTRSKLPFVGDKKVVFKDGKTEITLDSPHMSFEMELNYINDELNRAFKKQVEQEAAAKKQREQSQL